MSSKKVSLADAVMPSLILRSATSSTRRKETIASPLELATASKRTGTLSPNARYPYFSTGTIRIARVSSLGTVARLARQLSEMLGSTGSHGGTGELFTSETKGLTIVQLWERINEQTAEGKLSVGQLAQGLSLHQILRIFDWSVWVAFISALIVVGSATLGVDHWIMDLLTRAGTTH